MNELQNWAFCPYCNERFTVQNNEEFKLGYPVQCEQCSKRFNIFGIYEKIYHDIKIGTKIANEATEIIYSDYTIDGSIEYDISHLEKYMHANFGDEVFKDIILNSIVYGTCILQHVKIANILTFKPLHLPLYEIKTEVGTKDGGHALHQLIKEIRNYETNEVIPRKNLSILYVDSSLSNNEIGFSLYGMWFRIWAILNIGSDSISHSKLSGNTSASSKLTEIYEYYQNQMQNTISIIKMTNGKSERDTLAWRIETEVFPIIINKTKPKFSDVIDSDLHYPSIIFNKDIS